MRNFFHADTKKYLKRRKYILWLTLLPLFQGSVITALIVIVNLRAFYDRGYHLTAIRAVAAAAAGGTLFFFIVFAVCERLVKRNARYTFIDIGVKALVYSRYDGDMAEGGRCCVMRRLYVVPLSCIGKIGYSEKKNRVYLETEPNANIKIREYSDKSERLDYRFSDGFPEFESWWYNRNGFKNRTSLVIPGIFGSAERLTEAIAQTKKDFDALPKPKPYVHKESDFAKRKRAIERLKKLQKL
ncbi:MAG: hypothetical protein FWG70_09175 [Oscillospiraceae bacterium]|nr:hypothetical protein [Oscillospiraceae bacterium]